MVLAGYPWLFSGPPDSLSCLRENFAIIAYQGSFRTAHKTPERLPPLPWAAFPRPSCRLFPARPAPAPDF